MGLKVRVNRLNVRVKEFKGESRQVIRWEWKGLRVRVDEFICRS